ncbi:MAG: cytochrome c biogenesis protein ResB [Verrucomicrobiales bacterium]|nr:cytochrome c biogenesis protein ResB [Verrucomicrobiales bacterium]
MSSSKRATANPLVLLFRLFSSYTLAVVVLSLLLIITLLGTLAQADHGLLDSQRLYFDSWSVVHDFKLGRAVIPVWLPGGMLLMVLLFINMACGAVIRMRKGWRTLGVLISHLAIMFMLVAGFVSYLYKDEGAMPLFEGQASDLFQSYHQRVVEVREYDAEGKGSAEIWEIPMSQFQDLEPGKARTFFREGMPFEVQLTGYARNANVASAADNAQGAVDGYEIQPEKAGSEDERNLAAIVAVVKEDGKEVGRGILWEAEQDPYTVEVGGKAWTLSLTRRKWKLPFALRLVDFQKEVHPGTQKPKRFTSHVVKIKDGAEQPQVITMNVPLRDEGYVVYQASFSEGTNGEQSVFTVVSNPSDQWPLWSCVAVSIGLVIHFMMHLIGFLRRSGRSTLAASTSSTSLS